MNAYLLCARVRALDASKSKRKCIILFKFTPCESKYAIINLLLVLFITNNSLNLTKGLEIWQQKQLTGYNMLRTVFFLSETLSEFCVGVFDYGTFLDHLEALTEEKIWISPESSYAVYERVPEVRLKSLFWRVVHSSHHFIGEVTNYITNFKSPFFSCFKSPIMCCIIQLR